MPSKLCLLGIYYEKVINKSITLKLAFMILVLVSYDVSINHRNV